MYPPAGGPNNNILSCKLELFGYKNMIISKKTIRCYLLSKQFLLPPQSLQGQSGINKVFSTIHSIQFDPQNPCGTNVDLVLQARVKDIHPSDYYLWLYKQRRGIECYDKELCVVPIADLELCRKSVDNVFRQRRIEKFIQKNRAEFNQLILRIDQEGEISATQIKNNQKVKTFWGNPRWSKAALDVLWKSGELVISKRQNGRKYFDLPQKVYGEKYKWANCDKLRAEHIIRRIKSIGFLPKSGTGQGWLGIGKGREIILIVGKLLKNGVLTEVKVENTKKSYVMLSADFKFLKSTEKCRIIPKMVFLAPLDNLLWDRGMVKEIFDFEYKWEAYTPKNQRRYGHYVLPILYGDKFIGRIEPRQIGNSLEIRCLWIEPYVRWTRELEESFYSCLDKFGKYLNIKIVRWLCEKPKCSAWPNKNRA